MKYFMVKEIEYEESGERLFKYDDDIEINDIVVIPNYEGKPVTAKVTKMVDSFVALTSFNKIQSIIDYVDMKFYNEKQENEMKKSMILNKMQNIISDIQLMEKFKKYADKDEEMQELLEQYKAIEKITD